MDGPPRRPPRRQVKQGRREVLVPVTEQAAEVIVGQVGTPDGPPAPPCREQTCLATKGRISEILVQNYDTFGPAVRQGVERVE